MPEALKILIGIFITAVVLISGCLQEIKNEPYEETDYNETIYNYSTLGFKIDHKQASTVWEKVKFSDDAKFVIREKNYSVTVFVQSYTEGPIATEWIVVASSIPKKAEDIKIVIFRLDYQTFDLKRSYYISYPNGKELSRQQITAAMEEAIKEEPGGVQSINESAVALQDGNYIYSYLTSDIADTYLFTWDEISGHDNGRFIEYLEGKYNLTIEPRKAANVEKTDNNSMRIRTRYSTFLLRLNDEKTKVNLRFDDGRTDELVAKMENGKLNIYGKTNIDIGATIIFNKYAGRTIFHATRVVWIARPGPIKEVNGRLIIPGDEINGTRQLPHIAIRVESISSPAYRGTSTIAGLSFTAPDYVLNGTDILVDYRTEMLHPNGSLEPDPEGLTIIPEKKRLALEMGNGRLLAYSNLTVKTSNASDEGDYFITAAAIYRGWVVGKNVFSFKIGKGGIKSGGKSMTEGSQNIGYSADNPPPLNLTEKADMAEVALRDPYLEGRIFRLIGVTSEYLDLENYSGFFAVVAVDAGDPDYPGEIIRYTIDREEKKIIGSAATPRPALEYFRGEAFDEIKGNFTKRWDAWNFPGLWLDLETNDTTETLVINQSMLNNGYRIIDKHNLIYTTRFITLKYQVYARANITPSGTDGFYSAIGWQGEKYVLLDGNRIARIIFEQNASDVKIITTGYSWIFGDGYKLVAHSIEAPLEREAWIEFRNATNILDEKVLPDRYLYSYPVNLNNNIPTFITYISSIHKGPYEDIGEFKYTWLRSQDITSIEEGDTFGIMEVTSIDNGKIELRNREPVYLAPGKRIHLMGNISIQVGSSGDRLQFHPFRVRKP